MRNFFLFFSVVLLVSFFSSCEKTSWAPELQVEAENTSMISGEMSIAARADGTLAHYTILAGQHIPIGTATVGLTTFNGEQNLYINVDTYSSDWVAGTTHIFAGLEADIPTSGGGNPKNGHFQYGSEDIPVADILADLNAWSFDESKTYYIPLSELDTELTSDPTKSDDSFLNCFSLLVHIEAYRIEFVADATTSDGSVVASVVAEETGWAAGDPFPGANWAMFNNLCF